MSGGAQLLCESAVIELREDRRLHEFVRTMREPGAWDAGFPSAASRPERQDALAACDAQQLACQKAISALIEDLGFNRECALLRPTDFKRAVYAFGGPFSKAPLRRRAREMARIYALLAEDGLPTVRCVEDFHLMWEAAMEGEPRWSDEYPSSKFRTRPSRVLDSLFDGNVIQMNTDAANVEEELAQLLSFLADESLPDEVRAAAAFPAFEFTHPFADGNGHVGRMLVLSILQGRYPLQAMVRFSKALVFGKGESMHLFGLLRRGEYTLADFCHATLQQLLA